MDRFRFSCSVDPMERPSSSRRPRGYTRYVGDDQMTRKRWMMAERGEERRQGMVYQTGRGFHPYSVFGCAFD